MELLEEMIRGKSLNQSNETTKMFAQMYQKQLEHAGCIGPNREFLMDKYREALERNEVNIDLLCSEIGEEPLDQKFMNMKLFNE